MTKEGAQKTRQRMTYIPQSLRHLVHERARNCCEYCLLNEEDNFLVHEIDHIISENHGGETDADNLCLSCFECNRHKGSDVGSIDPETGNFISFFHPRKNQWNAHFRLNGAVIEPLTPQGRVTVILLNMNSETQVEKRKQRIEMRRYPQYDA